MKVAPLILSFLLLAGNTGNRSGVNVLCYHAFLDKNNKYCFSLKELRSHLDYLKKNGYRFVTLEQMNNGSLRGDKNILISIDDGNRSVYRAYQEVFKPLKIKPLLAVYPSIIGKKKYALTWDQLRYLSGQGCTIASHGYQHRSITEKLYSSNRKSFKNEIFLSKKILEKKLGRKVEVFVYPYGARSDVTIKYLKKAGYKYAFTVDRGMVNLADRSDSAFELPRYMLTRPNEKSLFASIIRNSSDQRIALNEIKSAGGKIRDPFVHDISPVDYQYYLNYLNSMVDIVLVPQKKIKPPDADGRTAGDFINYDYGVIDPIPDNNLTLKAVFANSRSEDQRAEGSMMKEIGRMKKVYFKITMDSYDYYRFWLKRTGEKIEILNKKRTSIKKMN